MTTSRRLPIERPNGAVEWVDVPVGEPAPYPTCNETDEPVDDRLARIYHCDRWATAATQALRLEGAIENLSEWVDQQIVGIRRSSLVSASEGALSVLERIKQKIEELR